MILDYLRLTGRVAIVTGSGEGIGQSIAVGFAEAGADVVLAARRRGLLEETADMVKHCGQRALVSPCDINDGAAQPDSSSTRPTSSVGLISWSLAPGAEECQELRS